jgi:hypothetical protein
MNTMLGFWATCADAALSPLGSKSIARQIISKHDMVVYARRLISRKDERFIFICATAP